MLGHYAGFSSWPDLISGGKGTNAGSASLATSPNAAPGHGGGTFLNIGPGSLPFAVGAAPLPLPGVAPAGPGVLVTNNGGGGPNGGGPNGGGPGNGGGPDGASASPVLVMYQKGIEQGSPDIASAIGVILVIGVLVVSLINRRLLERD